MIFSSPAALRLCGLPDGLDDGSTPGRWLCARCDYLSPVALDRAFELAETAVDLDVRLPQARIELGHILLFKRQHDAAIAEFERALAINPNFFDSRFALALTYTGEPARAIEVLEANIRLDPFRPLGHAYQMGVAHYALKHYREAVHWSREGASSQPNAWWPHLLLASAYAQSGQLKEARAEVAEVLRVNPGFTIESLKRLAPYKDPKDTEHHIDGARKAGLPKS